MDIITISYIIIAIVTAFFFARFQYVAKKKKNIKDHVLLIVLRFITVFLIMLLLVNPAIEKTVFYVEKPILTIATDNSSSIAFLNKTEEIKAIIKEFRENADLNKRFDVRYVTFGDNITFSDTLTFDKKQTKIHSVLNSLENSSSNSIAPVILLSDGNQTYGEDYALLSTNYKQQVYPVVIGDTTKYTDLKINQINVNKYAYHKNDFPVELFINYQGKNKVKSNFVIKSDGKTVHSQEIEFDDINNSRIVTPMLKANAVGVQSYTAEISPLEEERNTLNNIKEFAIEIIDQKTKVLIVSSIMHPDLGALKKSIENNDQREATIQSIADITISGVKEYQLIIIYQPDARFKALFDTIKKTNTSVFTITGTKTDWRFLNTAQSFYRKELSAQKENIEPEKEKGYTPFDISEIDFYDYPPLDNFLGDISFSINPDIILRQRIRNISTTQPMLATYEIDSIRGAVLFGENTWKWRAFNFLENKNFESYDNLMGKLIFYLSSNKKKERLEVFSESFYDGNNKKAITAQYFNDNYEFNPNARLNAILNKSSEETQQVIPMRLSNNFFEVDLSNLLAGEYNYTIVVEGENLSKSGKFKIIDFDIEKQFLNADKERLKILAENSGGKIYYPEQIKELKEDLLTNEGFKPIQKSSENVVPLIDWKLLLVFIVLLLSAEWFLRKYKGLI
ncbi:VWA domain-containing protein [Leptobacterium sp. I13]|uniref:VWA domain-containing protein n=1 Tax=Leptobacterium meishanense TaxID=3128904 RepID=UPI0030EC1465